MMYPELSKYKIGKEPRKVNVIGTDQTVTLMHDRYDVPLGDLIDIYIDLKNKPWWRRKYYHSHLLEIVKDALNVITIQIIK